MAALNRPSEVIYQIYPSSFMDANGDGCGDLQGITQKLDYVHDLGVDAIWISPFFLTPPGPEGDGGYAINDYRKIDPKFGTMEDFEALIAKAHSYHPPLRVYTDFVVCHTSSDHEWFKASRDRNHPDHKKYKDYYVWTEAEYDYGHRVPPNNWKSVFSTTKELNHSAWEWDEGRQQYYLHHFNVTQPALNLNKKEVQDASLAEMKFWLDKGVDGLRLDALPFANYDPGLRNNPGNHNWRGQIFEHSICQPETVNFVHRIHDMMHEYQPPRRSIGEVVAGKDGGRGDMLEASKYLKEGGLDTSYTQALVQFWYQYPTVDRLKGLIHSLNQHSPDGGFCINLSNHDFPRFATRMLDGSIPYDMHQTVIKQLMTLAVCLPGSFCMYQGDELGLEQALESELEPYTPRDTISGDSRDYCRTPMPWTADPLAPNAGFSPAPRKKVYLPVPEKHRLFAVDEQEKSPNSTLNYTKQLLKMRRENIALQRGKAIVLENTPPNVLGFLRDAGEETVLCAFNCSNERVTFRAGDCMDESTLRKLKLKADTELRMDPYSSRLVGAKLDIDLAQWLGKESEPINGNGAHDHTVKKIVSLDMLITDLHHDYKQIGDAVSSIHANEQGELSHILPGTRHTINGENHRKLLKHASSPSVITVGGATTCILGMVKHLMGDKADVTIIGDATDDIYGKAVKKHLDAHGIHYVKQQHPLKDAEPAVTHAIRHPDGKYTLLTHPGSAKETMEARLKDDPRLLSRLIGNSDIVFLPGSLVEKFGIQTVYDILRERWNHRKELILSLPSHAKFGPQDMGCFQHLFASANVIVGNDVEFYRIMEGDLSSNIQSRDLSEAQIKAVAEKVQNQFQQRILQKEHMPVSPHGQVAFITRGDKPALLVTERGYEEIEVPQVKPEEARNILGVGYAGFAGFLTGYLQGLPHQQSAQMAVGLAAEKLKQEGAEPYLRDAGKALLALLQPGRTIADRIQCGQVAANTQAPKRTGIG